MFYLKLIFKTNVTKEILFWNLIQIINQTKLFFFHFQVIPLQLSIINHNQYLKFYF
jgi:hypothetical protein